VDGRELSELDDASLMALIAADPRSQEAVREFYSRYATAVYSWVRKLTGDPIRSEDLVQEIFLRAWQRAKTYDPSRGPVGAWLYGIARNCVADFVRKNREQLGIPEQELAKQATSLDLEAFWIGGIVARALESLSFEHRQVLELAYFEHLTQREIADKLGIPVGTVKSRTFKALRKMRTALQSLGFEFPPSRRLWPGVEAGPGEQAGGNGGNNRPDTD
jgi:RNA polymerase sigma-70 factor (ECF subfamily)